MKDFSRLLELPPSERLQLVEAIWDSLVEVPEAVPVSDEVREMLDRRLAAYYANPSSARPWEEIRDDAILSVGVIHQARDESTWKKRS